jgi:hypothetical protein
LTLSVRKTQAQKRQTVPLPEWTGAGNVAFGAISERWRLATFRVQIPRARPPGGLNSNQGSSSGEPYASRGYIEAAVIEVIPWNGSSERESEVLTPSDEPRDALRLARYYQSLLYSGQFDNRAALARYLRVISDNGPQFIARDFKEFIRLAPRDPQPVVEFVITKSK